jgi:hypothetical protein
MPFYKNLLPGDPSPWFHACETSRPDYAFDTTAGRYLVLCFFATAADARGRAAVSAALALKHFFDDAFASFFGVTIDSTDESQHRVASRLPVALLRLLRCCACRACPRVARGPRPRCASVSPCHDTMVTIAAQQQRRSAHHGQRSAPVWSMTPLPLGEGT